jgi:hypothetical protein
MKVVENIVIVASCIYLFAASAPAQASDQSQGNPSAAGSGAASASAPLSEAEQWVKQRSIPAFMQQNAEEKKKKKPIRTFFKTVAKGAATELGTSMEDMGKDMIFVFSVQDVDPYAKKGPPSNKPSIVMQMAMVDGTIAYLHRFPDNSFAVEDGFADGTVMMPGNDGDFIIKYPNHVQGRVVFQGNQILIYRPDKTITTFKKTASGAYDVSNTKFGYMGTARADDTGDKL